MSEVLYEDQYLRVTERTIEKGSRVYPANTVLSVTRPNQIPMDIGGGVLLNGALFLLGLYLIFQFSLIWSTLGVLMALLGGYNVKGEFVRGWWLKLQIVGIEEIEINRQSKAEIEAIYHAIRQAAGFD